MTGRNNDRPSWRDDRVWQAGFLIGSALGAAATIAGRRAEKAARRGLVDWPEVERIAIGRIHAAPGSLDPAELRAAEPAYAAAMARIVPAILDQDPLTLQFFPPHDDVHFAGVECGGRIASQILILSMVPNHRTAAGWLLGPSITSGTSVIPNQFTTAAILGTGGRVGAAAGLDHSRNYSVVADGRSPEPAPHGL
jgi:hypothetical protein